MEEIKEYQICFKVDEKLFNRIESEREGTQRNRAAQIRYMIEKYLETRDTFTEKK